MTNKQIFDVTTFKANDDGRVATSATHPCLDHRLSTAEGVGFQFEEGKKCFDENQEAPVLYLNCHLLVKKNNKAHWVDASKPIINTSIHQNKLLVVASERDSN